MRRPAVRTLLALGLLVATVLVTVGDAVEVGAAPAGPSAPVASPSAPAAADVQLGGGSGIVFGHGQPVTANYYWYCTLTAVGYDRDGNLVGLTNAHCFYDNDGNQWPGDQIYAERAAPGTALQPQRGSQPDLELGVIGTVEHISGGNPIFPGPNGRGLDYAVIRLDESKVQPTATVGGITISEIGDTPGPGTIMCKHGRTSGLTCGMQLLDVKPYFTHTVWVDGGDSGSPVVVGETLVGNAWVTGAGTSMTAIAADLEARGELGAGFTPVHT
jgi:trypsin-like peptidase